MLGLLHLAWLSEEGPAGARLGNFYNNPQVQYFFDEIEEKNIVGLIITHWSVIPQLHSYYCMPTEVRLRLMWHMSVIDYMT